MQQITVKQTLYSAVQLAKKNFSRRVITKQAPYNTKCWGKFSVSFNIIDICHRQGS